MTKKEYETIKGIVNEVVAENNKVLLSRMESMEKRINGLSIDNAVGTKTKATKKSTKTTTKATKAPTTKSKATKSTSKFDVKGVNVAMAEDLGYDVVKVTNKDSDEVTYYIRQTTYQRNRKYREEAMKNEGRLREDKGMEKMKCYEFDTLEAVKTALKAVNKMIENYKKSVAKA